MMMQRRPARPAAADNVLACAGAKYGAEPGQVLRSSADRNWSDIFAELRFHREGHLDSFVQPTVEVVVQIRGSGTVNRRADGQSQKIESRSGAAWLCPLGIPVDFLELSSGFSETIHLYLGAGLFSCEGLGDGVSASAMANLQYLGGFHDPLLEQIGRVIATELAAETTSGNLLVETLGCSLAARLLQRYLRSDRTARLEVVGSRGLDRRRLRRILDHIESNLTGDLSIAAMASEVSLSRYHFARAFKLSTGQAPHQYVSMRRLEHAKSLLLYSDRPLADISEMLNFSSQASFTKAFRRVVGTPPGRYRSS
jgi:AraC family transcriptional regulator